MIQTFICILMERFDQNFKACWQVHVVCKLVTFISETFAQSIFVRNICENGKGLSDPMRNKASSWCKPTSTM